MKQQYKNNNSECDEALLEIHIDIIQNCPSGSYVYPLVSPAQADMYRASYSFCQFDGGYCTSCVEFCNFGASMLWQ